jgi:TonB family protein
MYRCRHRNTAFFALAWTAILVFTFSLPMLAQQSERGLRKRIFVVDPVYPEILKQAYIGGTVRLHITITSNGAVERISPLGGNPALVESAVHAVKKWKYVPAGSSSEQDVSIEFDPRHTR